MRCRDGLLVTAPGAMARPAKESGSLLASFFEPREEINYNVVAAAYAVASALCVLLFFLQDVTESTEGWWVVVRAKCCF